MTMSFHSVGVDSYSIDYFHGKHCAFFLTHVHTDHLCGLHNGWKRGNIICSEVTKTLLLTMFELRSDLIITLPLDCPSIVTLSHSCLTVTFIDANHCPGSIMIKVCGEFGSRLHSGDYRFSRALLENESMNGIRSLFLDTTFFHPSWRMPTKEQSCELLIDLILRKGNNKIVYIAADCYGQEDIFLALHRKFGQKVLLDVDHTGISARTRGIWNNWLRNVPYLQNIVTSDSKSFSKFRACASNGKGVNRRFRDTALNVFSLAKRQAKSHLFIRASTLWFGSRERFENHERVER